MAVAEEKTDQPYAAATKKDVRERQVEERNIGAVSWSVFGVSLICCRLHKTTLCVDLRRNVVYVHHASLNVSYSTAGCRSYHAQASPGRRTPTTRSVYTSCSLDRPSPLRYRDARIHTIRYRVHVRKSV